MTNYKLLEEKEEKDPQSDMPVDIEPTQVDNSAAAADDSKDAAAAAQQPAAFVHNASTPPLLSVAVPVGGRGSSFPFSPPSVFSGRQLDFVPASGPAAASSSSSSPAGHLPNPEEHCNPLSYVTYSWLSPIIDVGAKRPLEDSDLFQVRTDYAAKVASARFQREWDAEVRRAEAAGDRSSATLWRPFRAIYGRNYFLSFVAKAVGDVMSFVQPVLLQLLLSSLYTQTVTYCMTVAVAMFVAGTLSTICCNLYWRVTMVIGIQSRNCLITAVYRKSLRLSPKARQERSTGQIVNLMSTDASKIDSALGWAMTMLACLLQVCIAVALLLRTLGVSSLAGIAIIVVLIPLQGKMVGILQALRKRAVVWTDRRVKLSNEILQGMKVIKVYAYEQSFLARLTSIRLDEMALVRRGSYVRAAAVTFAQFGPIMMSLVAFIVLASTGGDLTPENVFAALVLFNLLRFPLMQLPFVGGMIADAIVSKGRIEQFLLSEEIAHQAEQVDDRQFAVRIEHADFSWETVIQDKNDGSEKKEGKEAEKGGKDGKEAKEAKPGLLSLLFGKKKGYKGKLAQQGGSESLLGDGDRSDAADSSESPSVSPALRDVDIRIPHGSLTVIVGSVGAGKSSLLSGILGEMKRLRGSVFLSGSVGYCHQSAWIQNCSLRNNILFGCPFDQRRYDEVLDVCELRHDISILPAGDATEIGEKGITLSGGQKQRVNLARGVYFDADILLLDDIFSALDMHVGAAIFKQCIMGTLKHKTRLLVTHQLQYAQHADHIIFVQDGRIAEQGPFEQLIRDDKAFAALIASYGGGANEEEEEQQAEAGAATAGAELNDEQKDADDGRGISKPRLSRGVSAKSGSGNNSRRGSLKEEEEAMKKAAKAANDAKLGDLMTLEERSTGGISWSVYRYYFRAMGSTLVLLGLFLIIVLGTGAKMATDLWLAWWSADWLKLSVHLYMIVYALLGLAQCLFVFLLAFLVAKLSTEGAVRLHDASFASVSRAPLSFFETTPLGRILHRFSKDQDTIDSTLSESIRSVIMLAAQIVGSLILMVVATPFFIFPLLPCLYLYYRVQARFRKSSREVKRMDSISRSPLFAHFSETLTGLSTIRAYHREPVFIAGNEERVDGNMRAYYLTLVLQRWIGLRLETLASALVFCSGAVIVVTSAFSTIDVGLAGLALSYALNMTTSLVFMIRQSIEAEMAMNSVERSQYYAEEIEQEKAAVLPADRKLLGGDHPSPQSPWPSDGRVDFHNLSMRYRANLPLILRDVSFQVKGGERIGIVGRTGAGKSSLMTALFRLVEADGGHVSIDDVDINGIGLTSLRQSISIIPQDAVLFSGTIRSNLDPFNSHSDSQLWAVLEKSRLKAAVSRLELKLEAPVNEGGENFSQGERCQLCLARAMLKEAKVLVMDEETDSLIQTSLREEFHCTILTIAHRLITVIDYDRILVLEAGRVVEFDTPARLLRKEGGAFRALVTETGETNADLLQQLAEQAEQKGGRISLSKEVLERAREQSEKK